jgi:uridine kinase
MIILYLHDHKDKAIQAFSKKNYKRNQNEKKVIGFPKLEVIMVENLTILLSDCFVRKMILSVIFLTVRTARKNKVFKRKNHFLQEMGKTILNEYSFP